MILEQETMVNLEELVNRIKEEESIIFYGAQMVASGVYTALKAICNPNVSCFVVTDLKNNPKSIDGIEVMNIDRFCENAIQGLILITTPVVHHNVICDILKQRGRKTYICIDSILENEIMYRYYQWIGQYSLIRDRIPLDGKDQKKEVKLYMVKSPVDSQLSKEYSFPRWYETILAGSAFADGQEAQVYDNVGDNISDKNRNYCELTATYWVWKNAAADYIGICHYRRVFDLSEEDIKAFINNDIDVILPLPTVNYPNAEEHHKRYISETDWNALRQALKEMAPDYNQAFDKVFRDFYFYNFNIFLAKKQVFDHYCKWMFPILERVEQICQSVDPHRKNRYMGYIGESLMSLYFLENKEKLKIEHSGNIMLL